MGTLLNQKLLKSRIEKFHFPENEKRQKIEKIISAWQKSFKESDLSKAKETSLQGKFFAKFFCEILGYTTQDDGNEVWTLKQEAKTEVDGKEADGSLGFYSKTSEKTRCVIELKDAQQPLDKKQLTRESKQTPVEQAFQYLYKFDGCDWVIVSNFRYTRLYHKSKGQTAYEEFDILALHEEKEFKRFYYCLCQENLLDEQARSPMDELVKQSGEACIDITKEFYLEFKNVRRKLFDHIVENNPDFDKKLLLEKTQKILDRFIFIFFCEDTAGLLPHNTVEKTYELGQASFSSSECKIWEQFRGLFVAIDKGNTRVKPPINAYNGGLFAYDEILDKQLIIRDEIFEDIKNLARYDFESDLNVNILGHIFEQSLSDLEQIKNELDGIQEEKKNAKRKKDGIFYTPEYITHYIVKETIGKYLEENPEKLEEIKILDPACGSGAFLNQAHSFLVQQRKIQRDEKIAQLGKSQLNFFEHINPADIDRSILLNNLYGVDLNKESVEITKLALWLKTAHAQCKLNNLDENIKCGNSLIDDETIAGDKAFKWEDEFPSLFKEKELKAYHITFRTYGSYEGDDVKNSSKNKYEKPDLSLEDEEFILNALIDVIEESELRVLALNICKNHVHMAVVCAYDEIEKYVQKIKSMTSRQLNIHKGITIPNKEKTLSQEKQKEKEKTQNRLWASKYDVSEISTEEELLNVINYIHHNRQKHNLPALQQDVQHRVMTLCWEINKAFVPYEKGGFDCIIGNPPYVQIFEENSKKKLEKDFCSFKINNNLYVAFIEKSLSLLKTNGYLGFIVPNTFIKGQRFENLRNVISQFNIIEIIDFGSKNIFQDATVFSSIVIIKKSNRSSSHWNLYSDIGYLKGKIEQHQNNFLIDNPVLKKLNSYRKFDDLFYIKDVGYNYWSIGRGKIRGNSIGSRIFYEGKCLSEQDIPYIKGSNITRYNISNPNNFLKHNYKDCLNENDIFRFSEDILEKNPKIVYRQTSNRLIGAIDNSSYHNDKTVHIIIPKENYNIDLRSILCIFNSKLMNYCYTVMTEEEGQVFAQVKTVNVKKLPILNLTKEQQNSLSLKAEKMIELNKRLHEETQKALELIKLEYQPKKISQKLEVFYTLGVNPFIEELDKLGVMTPSAEPAGKTSGAKPTEKSQSKSQSRDTTRASKLTL
ncbi:MAG: N-6 DNA methylase, partial [Acetobacter sp.]|nr:N-6 DNA methylase [Acetobacter sp.]